MTGKHLRPKFPKSNAFRKNLGSPDTSDELSGTLPHQNDLLIMLDETERSLQLMVWIDNQWLSFRSDILSGSLAEIDQRFRTTARSVLRGERQASELAAVGHSMFVRLFPSQEIRDRIRLAFERKDGLRVEVVGDPHLFPWNFLHIYGEEDPKPKWFWGARARIKRSLKSNVYQRKHPARLSAKQALIQIGLDSSLPHARDAEVPYILRLEPKHARTKRFTPLKGSDTLGQIRKLRKQMMNGGAQIIHFACHGDKNGAGKSAEFTIDKNFVVSSDILFTRQDKMKSGPIVFLNACEMAANSLDSDQAFIQQFLGGGARVVLAPECHVSDEKSAAFACLVYDKLVRAKKPLGDAVRETTCEMLSRHELTGLMYTIHGQADAYLP